MRNQQIWQTSSQERRGEQLGTILRPVGFTKSFKKTYTQPPMVVCKMEVQFEYTIAYTFGANSYAQSVLINKIFASELSRKFSKSALLVG